MFCGGKKPEKKQTIQQDETNLCQTHKKPYDAICIDQKWSGNIRVCQACREQNKLFNNNLISYSELNQQIQQNDFDEFVLALDKIQKDWSSEWKKKQLEQIKKIKHTIIKMVDDLIVSTLLQDVQTTLTNHEIALILDPEIIHTFSELTNQQTNLQKLRNDDVFYLLARLTKNKKEYQMLSDIATKDFTELKFKVQSLQEEIDQKIDIFSQNLQKIPKKVEEIEQIKNEPLLEFMNSSVKEKAESIQMIQKQLEKVSGTLAKNIQLKTQDAQLGEHVQIRAFAQITDSLVAFCSNLKQIHLIEVPALNVINVLEEDADVINIGKCQINHQIVLISAIEEESGYSLSIWNLDQLSKIAVFNAHSGHIWNITELPDSRIATCSDDMVMKSIKIIFLKSIKIWNMVTKKCTLELNPHQASVNDLALISDKLIVSVSDDQTLAVSNIDTGIQVGFTLQENEIKCVCALNGDSFVTGDGIGTITIYAIEKLEVIFQLKVHKSLIRNIVRINSQIIATASWDGTHIFFQCEDHKVIKQIEGPRNNFSEGIIWLKEHNFLLAGSGGKIKIYK